MLDKSAVSSKSRQPFFFTSRRWQRRCACTRVQDINSTPSTPSTPKTDFFPLSAPFFLVNWSYTSNNVRCPWQAPGGKPLLSSLLFISEPIFLLPLLRQIQLFLYHLPILHTHCYYDIDFQCFVFQSLLLVRDSKNRVSLFSTLSVKIDTEHRFLLQFLSALYMVTTEWIRTPST